MRRALIVIVVVIVAGAALWWSQTTSGPFVVSGFIEADEIRVGSRVGGRVCEVIVDEGQPVAGGDVLVTLEPYNLRERLAEARATHAAKVAILEKLRAGYRPEEIEQARARRDYYEAVLQKREAGPRPLEIQIKRDNVAAAKAELQWAESEHERVRKLFENEQAAEEEMDDAVRRWERAQAEFAAAQNALALAEEGTRTEEIAEARANLAEAQAQVKQMEAGYRKEDIREAEAVVQAAKATVATIERQIEELRLVAPTVGLIEAIDLQPGDLVAANAPVLTILETSHLWVRAYVPENRLDISVGQKVLLGIDALPEKRFAGHVVFVSRQAEFTPHNVQTPKERVKQVFRIKVVIDEGFDVLRPGMSADVYLDTPQ